MGMTAERSTAAAGATTMERHWTCSRRLRERRHALALTQADVVARLAAGGQPLTNRALSTMENGRGPDLGWLPELAAALECTVTYLLGLTDDPRRWEPDAPLPAAVGTANLAPEPARPAAPHRSWILGPDPPGSDSLPGDLPGDAASPAEPRPAHRRPR
jgi:transcriptional regulator with XRE-family HTH domain